MSHGRLRVLMVAPFPQDLQKVIGGVEAATSAVSIALAQHPDVEKVLVISIYEQGGTARRINISDKLQVEFIRPPFLVGDGILQSAQVVPAVRRLAKAFKPHVVHGQGLGRQGRVAARMGYPFAITVHGLVNVEARMAARGLAGRIRARNAERSVRSVLKAANVVISISDYDARELVDLVKSPRASIPNAVPAEFFEAAGKPSTPGEILFAGVMRARKNVLGLVNAFSLVSARFPEARLKIAGPVIEADYQAAVEARVQELGLATKVEFLGHVSNARLIAAMSSCAVLALFSEEETLPTVIAQAMAVGRPIVASDVGGIGEMVIDGETGWKVPAGDEDALAARLTEILSDPIGAQVMGTRGIRGAQDRFAAGAVANSTVAAYRTAISGFGSART